jgi:hypothetical protein
MTEDCGAKRDVMKEKIPPELSVPASWILFAKTSSRSPAGDARAAIPLAVAFLPGEISSQPRRPPRYWFEPG